MERRQVLLWFMTFISVAAHEVEEEGGEEKPDKSAYSMGLTMLGMAVLITFLYRLTHAKRQETREISWKLISGTVSIFVGVVVYSSLNDFFNMFLVEEGVAENSKVAVNRFWVLMLYSTFLFFISKKAKLGLPGTRGCLKERLSIIEDTGIMVCRKCKRVQTDQQGTDPGNQECEFCGHLGCQLQAKIHTPPHRWMHEYKFGQYLRKASQIFLMEEPEYVKGGLTSKKSVVCSMKGSLFWAHAIGFAGIDGWNMSQQKACKDGEKELAEGACVKNSLLLIARALLQYYIMLRGAGIFWRFIMKKCIQPKCYKIIKSPDSSADHDEILKAIESLKELDKMRVEGRNIKEWRPAIPEEGEEPVKQQEFQREDGYQFEDGTYFYQFRYEFEAEGEGGEEEGKGGEERAEYFEMKVNGVMVNKFPAPNWWQYKFKVGDDCQAVPEYDELVEEWDDIRKDGENDFFALAMSFLVVQTVRLLLGGHLPDKEEDEYLFRNPEEGITGHSVWAALALFLVALGCLVCAFYAYALLTRNKENPLLFKKHTCGYKLMNAIHSRECQILRDEFHETVERSLDILVDVLCMSASWSALYGTQWLLARWEFITMRDSAVLTVMLAVTVTFVMFMGLFAVDFVLDTPSSESKPKPLRARTDTELSRFERARDLRESHKGAFRKINASVGLLIGFAWEADFDEAVDKIAETLNPEHPVIFKTICAIIFLVLLLPVWFGQIIPMSEEQGWKFGFIPRRAHARMIAIHNDLEGHPDGDPDRAGAHCEHISEHRPHLEAISHKIHTVTEMASMPPRTEEIIERLLEVGRQDSAVAGEDNAPHRAQSAPSASSQRLDEEDAIALRIASREKIKSSLESDQLIDGTPYVKMDQ